MLDKCKYSSFPQEARWENSGGSPPHAKCSVRLRQLPDFLREHDTLLTCCYWGRVYHLIFKLNAITSSYIEEFLLRANRPCYTIFIASIPEACRHVYRRYGQRLNDIRNLTKL